MHPRQPTTGAVLVDGAGERYEVLGWDATFTVQPLDRPERKPFKIPSSMLRDLGMEWDGRTLKEVGSGA